MAVLWVLSLRMLWISCLLISSVTCLPAWKGFGSPYPGGFPSPAAGFFGSLPAAGGFGSSPLPDGYMLWSSPSSVPREPHTALGANVDLLPAGQDAGGVGFGSAGGGSVGTGSSSSNSMSTGGDDGLEVYSEGEQERPQPVFTDVSNIDPVYILRSRSGYRNGRRHFSKTRYTPGEVVFPPRPVGPHISNQPINTSPKGGQ